MKSQNLCHCSLSTAMSSHHGRYTTVVTPLSSHHCRVLTPLSSDHCRVLTPLSSHHCPVVTMLLCPHTTVVTSHLIPDALSRIRNPSLSSDKCLTNARFFNRKPTVSKNSLTSILLCCHDQQTDVFVCISSRGRRSNLLY